MKTACLFAHIVILAFVTCVAKGGVPSLVWISDAKEPVKNVYLDFDNTLTIDGFSEVVRNAFCKTEKYPDCDCGELCNDTMVRNSKLIITSYFTKSKIHYDVITIIIMNGF